jgi:ribA/ribD-fused uncharacterized protein
MERVTDKYVFFWGSEFSNWYDCSRYPYIKYKSITFFNSEQAFMWEKAVFFHDMEIAKKIVETPDPRENKALGRKIRGFDSERWMIASYPIMVAVNYAKYSQNVRLKALLLETEDKILVEASPYDKIWGIGLSWQDDDCLDETKWKGMNLLGKALMEVRKQLQEEPSH